jgi:hypothetical protein
MAGEPLPDCRVDTSDSVNRRISLVTQDFALEHVVFSDCPLTLEDHYEALMFLS